jgi:membrane protein implicated in regulation of membrane protease activity
MKQTIHDILLVIGILMLAMILFGGPLMLLWNGLMPTIFGLPEIGFWQACGLQLLATILFKSTSLKTNKD